MYLLVVTIAGLLLGRLAAGWSAHMLRDMNSGGLIRCPGCQRSVSSRARWVRLLPIRCSCGKSVVRWHLASTLGLGALFALFAWLLIEMKCESVHEVRPDGSFLYGRLPFHLALIFLLWTATVTDLLDYMIPDPIIITGIAIAFAGAVLCGELQMMHIWVNWDDVIPGVRGPYLPEWMKEHEHLHGAAWSFSGLVCGSILTWLVRNLSGWILGYPALGAGDVTLMAMIGAFLGWQASLCVLAIAPITGMVVGLFVRIFQGRSFVAFGPYLAISAVIVMCTWRWIWADYFKMRIIFSHWPSVAGLVGFSYGALLILLFGLRMFRSIPVERRA